MLTMVVPTSGRPKLAAAAVRALVRYRGDDVRVVVSDTSSDAGQAAWLEHQCRRLDDPRLTYVRAPDLPMGEHWDWAIARALELTDATHASLHYDRVLFRRGGLRRLLSTIELREARTVTYAKIFLSPTPTNAVWAIFPPETGDEFEVRTGEIVRWTSEANIPAMGQAWPILSNAAVHRDVLAAIRARFGSYCEAAYPDAAFGYRFCAVEETSVHIDQALAVIRAPNRSAGLGYISGVETDFADFVARNSRRQAPQLIPLPELNLGYNMTFNEYELVRREVPELPPIPRHAYLNGLADGLRFVRDQNRRAELADLLRSEGWTGADDDPVPFARHRWRGKRALARQLVGGRPLLLASLLVGRVLWPRSVAARFFRSEREAVWWAMRLRRAPADDLPADPELGRALLDHRLG